jgi:hypothetical protein
MTINFSKNDAKKIAKCFVEILQRNLHADTVKVNCQRFVFMRVFTI